MLSKLKYGLLNFVFNFHEVKKYAASTVLACTPSMEFQEMIMIQCTIQFHL